MPARRIFVLCCCLTAAVAGCSSESSPDATAQRATRSHDSDATSRPVAGRAPKDLVIDPAKGTFGRVALGDSRRRVERLLGRPLRDGLDEPAEPIGEDYYEIGGPTHFRSPYPSPEAHGKEDILRYRRHVIFMSAGGVYAWVSTAPGAQTRRVRIGDSQSAVRHRYQGARCYTANEGTEWVRFPLCEVVVCPGRRLYFGSDPIKSIWLVASSRRALTSRCMAARR